MSISLRENPALGRTDSPQSGQYRGMLTFKSPNIDLHERAPAHTSSNRGVARGDGTVAVEWSPFAHEPGGKLTFPKQHGVSLELHLLQDDNHFLPVWLVDGILVATINPAEA
jgi:hypothetical protein